MTDTMNDLAQRAMAPINYGLTAPDSAPDAYIQAEALQRLTYAVLALAIATAAGRDALAGGRRQGHRVGR